jgi:perosamine synthetase
MYNEKLLLADICRLPFTSIEVSEFCKAIEKVWENKESLRML